jgi:hypothetical protein
MDDFIAFLQQFLQFEAVAEVEQVQQVFVDVQHFGRLLSLEELLYLYFQYFP